MNLPLICPVIINLWKKNCKCPCRRTDGQSEIQMPQIFNYKLYRKYFLEFFIITFLSILGFFFISKDVSNKITYYY